MVIHSSKGRGGRTVLSQDISQRAEGHSPVELPRAEPTARNTWKSEARPLPQARGRRPETPAERSRHGGFLKYPVIKMQQQ